jgi:hypothetical protein
MTALLSLCSPDMTAHSLVSLNSILSVVITTAPAWRSVSSAMGISARLQLETASARM